MAWILCALDDAHRLIDQREFVSVSVGYDFARSLSMIRIVNHSESRCVDQMRYSSVNGEEVVGHRK